MLNAHSMMTAVARFLPSPAALAQTYGRRRSDGLSLSEGAEAARGQVVARNPGQHVLPVSSCRGGVAMAKAGQSQRIASLDVARAPVDDGREQLPGLAELPTLCRLESPIEQGRRMGVEPSQPGERQPTFSALIRGGVILGPTARARTDHASYGVGGVPSFLTDKAFLIFPSSTARSCAPL